MILKKKKIGIFLGGGFLTAILCFLWAFFVEPDMLSITRERVFFEVWKGTKNCGKIAVVGDFHFAPGDAARAKKITAALLSESPDAVFLLGDYVNGHRRESSMLPEEIAGHLGRLAEKVPVWAVLGNHDAYVGRREITDALRRVGIRVFDEKGTAELCLKNGTRIAVGGTVDAHGFFPVFDAKDVPENPSAGILPFILLSHSPDVLPFLNATIDLTLCGHTHGGQICLPGGFPVFNSCRIAGNKFASGMRSVPASRKPIFITRGLGTSILPLRFFCPPEIALIELLPAEPSPRGSENNNVEKTLSADKP